MKRRLFAVLLGLSALVVLCVVPLAQAQVRVYVDVPPPAAISEPVPVLPSPRHLWIPGHYQWDGQTYVWVRGHFALRPRPRAVWVPGSWVADGRRWYWSEGYWR